MASKDCKFVTSNNALAVGRNVSDLFEVFFFFSNYITYYTPSKVSIFFSFLFLVVFLFSCQFGIFHFLVEIVLCDKQLVITSVGIGCNSKELVLAVTARPGVMQKKLFKA